jgi:hypothetical protein
MFNFFKKLNQPTDENLGEYRIMQNQVSGKYFIQKWGNDFGYETLHKDGSYYLAEYFGSLYFDTLEQAEAKIAEFKAEEEKKELLKNPKIIKYL